MARDLNVTPFTSSKRVTLRKARCDLQAQNHQQKTRNELAHMFHRASPMMHVLEILHHTEARSIIQANSRTQTQL